MMEGRQESESWTSLKRVKRSSKSQASPTASTAVAVPSAVRTLLTSSSPSSRPPLPISKVPRLTLRVLAREWARRGSLLLLLPGSSMPIPLRPIIPPLHLALLLKMVLLLLLLLLLQTLQRDRPSQARQEAQTSIATGRAVAMRSVAHADIPGGAGGAVAVGVVCGGGGGGCSGQGRRPSLCCRRLVQHRMSVPNASGSRNRRGGSATEGRSSPSSHAGCCASPGRLVVVIEESGGGGASAAASGGRIVGPAGLGESEGRVARLCPVGLREERERGGAVLLCRA